MTALLEIRGLRVVFDGFAAVDGVDLDVPENDLRFLIGPNGAGKTTLVDAVTGLARCAGGTITLAGADLRGRKEHEIVRLGVGRTFQTASVIEALSVVDNLDIAAGAGRSILSLLRRRRGIEPAIADVLERIGLQDVADRPAGVLAHGQKQWLEIGMLLVQDCKLLLLDEPVAGMSEEERAATGELLTQLATERTVVVVEHDMHFLRQVAKSVTVLHEGKVLSEGSVAQVQADPRVQEVYLGPGDADDPAEVDAFVTEGA
ncbi:MAG: urea transport system ATP-binding protein [Frankiaceae bacterium]|nr:urea transport system ATP-binding protein [Frankiaceae bacterium]